MAATFTYINHKFNNLSSLSLLRSTLPEFFEIPQNTKSLIDKAFFDSIVTAERNVKHWKDFRINLLNSTAHFTPREIARLKFSLSHNSTSLKPVLLGRETMHN